MKKFLACAVLAALTNLCYAETSDLPKCNSNHGVTIYPKNKANLVGSSSLLLVDQYYSPFTGSAFNMTVLDTYKLFDDKFLSDSYGKINFLWGSARVAKVIAESYLSSWISIEQHEIFGHGYRGRELGFTNISYKIAFTHGYTGLNLAKYNSLSYPQRTALVAGGVEATTILSQQIRNNWFLSDQIDRRDARLFITSALDQPLYIYGTNDETTSAGNDIVDYVQNINAWYGNQVLSVSKLRGKAWWDFLDPNLYMAVYSIGTYVFDSSAYTNMCMFNIKGFRYLPSPRLILAPWGPEFQIQNHIVTPKQQLLQVNLRYGKTSFIKSYGLDVLMNRIWEYKGVTFGNKLYIWNQPQYLKQNTAVGIKHSFGIADYVSAETKPYKNMAAYGEFGYKTSGFIQGNPLGNSWVWRLGFKMNLATL